MRRRTVHACFAVAAVVCGAMAIWSAVHLQQAERVNAAIAGGRASGSGSGSDSGSNSALPQARLAQALTLARAGQFTPALKMYKSLLETSDEVRLPALYNLGNLNMREALKNGQGEAQRYLPLIELAKQSYRDELRSYPGDWDARYNLERALWLSPEYDDPMLQRSQTPVRSEHAVSTLQGAKIDLP
jgi:mxaK protein